jgi:hypothetical protein
MESELFENWQFNGGMYHNGTRAGQTIVIQDAAVGKIVVLTTRRKDQSEDQRKIVGLYEVGKIDNGNLIAHKHRRIRLNKDEADMLDFWRYHRNKNGNTPCWRTGLHRYLKDGQVHRILADVSAIVGGSNKKIINDLIQLHFKNNPVPPASGCLNVKQTVEQIAAQKRKYPGGEGPEHRKLKEWIARHPSVLGLPAASKSNVEYLFESGDCVDIAFELPDGSWAVVEIETTIPYPGAHQAIKYRSLLAAKKRWNLDTGKVTALLVAWDFNENTLDFCRQYSINAWKCFSGNNSGERII